MAIENARRYRGLVMLVALAACGEAVPRPETPPAAAPPLVSSPCPTVTATASAQAPAAPSEPAFPSLSWITTAEVVRIERGWYGLGDPWVAHYDLHRQGDGFVGLAMATKTKLGRPGPGAPHPPDKLLSGARVLTVPLAAMSAFLEALSRTTAFAPQPGRVMITASDDYPWWIIDVTAKPECASGRCGPPRAVHLTSPGSGDRPPRWYLWTTDRPLDLDASSPTVACQKLIPHLGDEALEKSLH